MPSLYISEVRMKMGNKKLQETAGRVTAKVSLGCRVFNMTSKRVSDAGVSKCK